jgi:hypothetical protein
MRPSHNDLSDRLRPLALEPGPPTDLADMEELLLVLDDDLLTAVQAMIEMLVGLIR